MAITFTQIFSNYFTKALPSAIISLSLPLAIPFTFVNLFIILKGLNLIISLMVNLNEKSTLSYSLL